MKLHIDLPGHLRIGGFMDDDCLDPDWREIITQLRLEAGRIMENTSCELAMTLPTNPPSIDAHLREVREAADDVEALLAAAQVLHRRCLGLGDQA